jgi:F0F1-type ATP synthase assembly protein I
MAGRRSFDRAWIRHASLGIDLAAAVAGFTLIGYWVDRRYGTKGGTIIGACLGLFGGMYNLIRGALKAARQANQRPPESEESDDSK